MSPADRIALPRWCCNQAGHALVEQIIATRPEPHTSTGKLPATYGGYSEPSTTIYRGEAATALRQMHSAWLDYEQAILDRQYHVSGFYDQPASDALFRVEGADALVARVLAETEEQIVEVERLEPRDGYAARIAA